jgi:juvenile hormone diol kinase
MESLRRRKMVRLFDVFDANGNGFLEAADLELVATNAAKLRGHAIGSPEHKKLHALYMGIWQAQQATKDRIPKEEWLAARDKVLADKQAFMQKWIDGLADTLFRIVDANGDDRISLQEYEDFLKIHGRDPKDAALIFPKLDVDGDGFVSREEMKKAVVEFYFSDDATSPGNWLFGEV